MTRRRRRVARPLRVAVLLHPDLMPADSIDGLDESEYFDWKTEYDVVSTLRDLGHEVRPLGVRDELAPIRETVAGWRPHVAFNLLEEFQGLVEFDQHVASYLELLGLPYTGCNGRGLFLARDKGLSKKILAYHRIRTPRFAVFRRGQRRRRPRELEFPLIVKSLTEESSTGIAQASIVHSDEALAERVAFVHDGVGTAAIVETFIEGRELYVGLLGNRRPRVLPTWELLFENLSRGAVAIATARAKHDPKYQEARGIVHTKADVEPALEQRIARTSRRIYRVLQLDGYARIDYRLSPEGELYFLEANPNPEIASSQEFASAAEEAGLPYPDLLQTILQLGLARARA